MARADLLVQLVKAGSAGDQRLFRRAVEAIIAEERAKRHNVLAERLDEELNSRPLVDRSSGPSPTKNGQAQQLVTEVVPRWRLGDLILPERTRRLCCELIEEHERRTLLQSYGLEPRHRLLLIGPPGNGKTSLAEAIAEALMLPLLVIRYESVIGRYLGETSQRLRQVFDHVKTRECVLFFDEFDTLGKERGDANETGEIKRVVSSLLLQMDEIPSHVIVVTATNHSELLDRAVWRRFQIRLTMNRPDSEGIVAWLKQFERRVGRSLGISLGVLAHRLEGASYSDLEEFGNDVMRRLVLEDPAGDIRRLVERKLEDWLPSSMANDPVKQR